PQNDLVFDNAGVWLMGNYATYHDLVFNSAPSLPNWAEKTILPPTASDDSLASFMQQETTDEMPWDHLSKGTAACEAIESLTLSEVKIPLIPSSNPPNNWISGFLNVVGRKVLDIPPRVRQPGEERYSTRFSTLDEKLLHLSIGGINGI